MTTRQSGVTTHLLLVATGTRSEILPLLALAFGLREVGGFTINVASNAIHAPLATRYGFGFSPLKGDPHSVLRSAAAQDAIAAEAHRSVGSMLNDAAKRVLEDNCALIHKACLDADGILCATSVLTESASLAQKYQIPLVLLSAVPSNPSGEIPLASYFKDPLAFRWLNKLTYSLSGLLLWSSLGGLYNKFRTETLKIGPQKGFVIEGIPQVTCFSEAVVPRPSDWNDVVISTGFWQFPQSVAAAGLPAVLPQLHRLLSSYSSSSSSSSSFRSPRDRPIYVGFESVVVTDPVTTLRTLHLLSRRIGIPIVFACGSTDVEAARTSALLEGCEGIQWEITPTTMVSTTAGGSANRASMAEVLRNGSFLATMSSPASTATSSSSPASRSLASSAAALGSSTAMMTVADEYADMQFESSVTDLLMLTSSSSSSGSSSASSSAGAMVGAAPSFTEESITALTVLVVREAPLEWVLPRCSLAVHAASSLAFQAAVNAGIPSVCFPAVGENFFWATRAASLGVALPYSHFNKLNSSLEESIEAARNHPTLTTRAAGLAESLRATAASRLSAAVAASGAEADSSSAAAALASPSSLDLGYANVLQAVGTIRDILSRPQHRHCGVTCRWVPDSECGSCAVCSTPFTVSHRRHHCRSCGACVCASQGCQSFCHLPGFPDISPQRTCVPCLDRRRAFLASHYGKAAVPEPTMRAFAGASAEAYSEPTAAAAAGGGIGPGYSSTSPSPSASLSSSSSSSSARASKRSSSSSSGLTPAASVRASAAAIPMAVTSSPVPMGSGSSSSSSTGGGSSAIGIASSFQRSSMGMAGASHSDKVDRSGFSQMLAAAGGTGAISSSLSRSFHQGAAGMLGASPRTKGSTPAKQPHGPSGDAAAPSPGVVDSPGIL